MSESQEPGQPGPRQRKPYGFQQFDPDQHVILDGAEGDDDDSVFEDPPQSTADVRSPGPPVAPVAPASAVAVAESEIKIGLWGSPQSGKTTFLAALRHATNEATCGSWNVFPLTTQSSNLLYSLSQDLNKGRFPPATYPGSHVELHWLFHGDVSNTPFDRRPRRLLRRGRADSRFVLDLIDVSGFSFQYAPEDTGVADIAMTSLGEADGILYLFDPIGERDNRDSVDYMNWTITEMKRRYMEGGGRDRYLPQHVSVCITKFDDPEVFQEARANGWVEIGPNGMPRVPDRDAKELFTQLCTGKFWGSKYEQGERSAQFIMSELQSAFGPDKIEYFVSSSIGFWKPMGWSHAASEFDPEDFANYRPGDEATMTPASIRGAISPINVLEPLIRLQQRIAERGGA
jgi:hypothetical protein